MAAARTTGLGSSRAATDLPRDRSHAKAPPATPKARPASASRSVAGASRAASGATATSNFVRPSAPEVALATRDAARAGASAS